MVDIWYINTLDIKPTNLVEFEHMLPIEMLEEIRRFRFHEDRRLKMMGRLLIRKYFKERDDNFEWDDWFLNSNGKPHLKGKSHFNVAHSGDMVIVAFSENELGVDIEKPDDFDIVPILSYLHESEQDYIQTEPDTKDAFYTIWTRKEAYLKARGVGIVQGLNLENCLEPFIENEKRWYLNSPNLIQNYHVGLCTEFENPSIQPYELGLKEIYEV